MNKEMFNELFKDVVVCGRYPLEKLHEMDWYIRSLEDKIKDLKTENQTLEKKLNKAINLLIEYNLPCDIENFNIRNADYCSSNCSVDKEVFKKCWLKYIEQELEND